jgi:hypothetical protein
MNSHETCSGWGITTIASALRRKSRNPYRPIQIL